MTKKDEAFRKEMIEMIRHNFADLLGRDIWLLDEPDGLDRIARKFGFRP